MPFAGMGAINRAHTGSLPVVSKGAAPSMSLRAASHRAWQVGLWKYAVMVTSTTVYACNFSILNNFFKPMF